MADREEFDVIGDFAARLSVTVACMAIGLPVEDGQMLTDWVQRFFAHDPDSQGFAPEGGAALQELVDYCTEKVKERRKNPVDSPEALSAISTFEFDGRRYDDADAGSHVSMLVIGGSETFPKVLANGLRRLREHPDQRATLAADPSRIPDAFNEILRYDMPTQFLGRTLTKDVEIHGQTMKKDQGLIFLYALCESGRARVRRSGQLRHRAPTPADPLLRRRSPPVPGHARCPDGGKGLPGDDPAALSGL